MKKFVASILTLILLLGTIAGTQLIPHEKTVLADVHDINDLQIGDYILLGKYNEEPILWRYISDDDNGKLMLSDKILCIKPFDVDESVSKLYHSSHDTSLADRGFSGSNYWADSNIRSWLNSRAQSGQVKWLCNCPPIANEERGIYNGYAEEKGFLADGNFTVSERKTIKKVTQKQLLDPADAYPADAVFWEDFPLGFVSSNEYNYDALPSENVTDKMFLLDIKQLRDLYRNRAVLGDYYLAERTPKAENSDKFNKNEDDSFYPYYLRTPYGKRFPSPSIDGASVLIANGNSLIAKYANEDGYGIRPAFYLDEENAMIVSGSGTEKDPFIIDGNDDSTEPSIEIGKYFQFGKYNDEPIMWKCVAEDENGKLFLTTKILCDKPFATFSQDSWDQAFWEKSYLREWLNSNSDGVEKGFLHSDNFSNSEQSLLKTVTQWTMLPQRQLNLATNGETEAFCGVFDFWYAGPQKGSEYVYYHVPSLAEVYRGAAHQVTDRMFLVDELQLYQIYTNYEKEKNIFEEQFTLVNDLNEYWWLRSSNTPVPSDVQGFPLAEYDEMNIAYTMGYGSRYSGGDPFSECGVRPAFYLNEENAMIVCGNGTEEEPYILDGKDSEKIHVFCDRKKLEFDQQPIMENDRVLVPFRVIFEALGATVDWDVETQTVTAVRGDINISLQINNNIMYKNGNEIQLDVPARLLNDRTLVPIRAISEALDAHVDWKQETKSVIISTSIE